MRARAQSLTVSADTMKSSISLSALAGENELPDPIVRDDSLVAYSGPSGSLADIMAEGIDENFDASNITTYIVKRGDTLASVAELFDISVTTIRLANGISKGAQLKPGQELLILPVDAITVTVPKGATIAGLAKTYHGDAQEIRDFNDITDAELRAGMKLVIPGGEIPTQTASNSTKKTSSRPISTNSRELMVNGYLHPLKGAGRKTQGFHGRWNGVDFGTPIGTPIYAVMDGVVTVASTNAWGGGYGHMVVISHPNGMSSLYGHMSTVGVTVGQRVSQGDQIGLSGNTGRSTGPHLHLEFRGAGAVIPW